MGGHIAVMSFPAAQTVVTTGVGLILYNTAISWTLLDNELRNSQNSKALGCFYLGEILLRLVIRIVLEDLYPSASESSANTKTHTFQHEHTATNFSTYAF